MEEKDIKEEIVEILKDIIEKIETGMIAPEGLCLTIINNPKGIIKAITANECSGFRLLGAVDVAHNDLLLELSKTFKSGFGE